MTGPSDTEPSGPPTDADMLDGIAHDLAALRDVASTLGDDLDELVALLQKQANAMRGKS